jgi:hypothetical protein
VPADERLDALALFVAKRLTAPQSAKCAASESPISPSASPIGASCLQEDLVCAEAARKGPQVQVKCR